jgi:hypothetical protein
MKKRDWLILAAVLLVLVVWVENRDSVVSSAEFACSITIVTDDEWAQTTKGDDCKPELSRMLSGAGLIAWRGDR